MRIHHLQHVAFEGLSSLEPILTSQGHRLSSTHLYESQSLPAINEIDWLIVIGGPMGVDEEKQYPWLIEEKKFIKEAIYSGKIVLGICLGAQLIADALGAKVTKNKHREIGWFNICRSPEIKNTILSTVIPEITEVFHWHGDTFNIPQGARALAESEACKNQGFIFDDRVLAFQFHLETTMESATALINNCSNDLDGSHYVQTKSDMLSNNQRFLTINQLMVNIVRVLEEKNTALISSIKK